MDIGQAISGLGDILAWFNQSVVFRAVLVFLFVYTVVLIIDIALLLYVHGLRGDIKKIFLGTGDRPLASKASMRRKWGAIKRRLSSDRPSEYKVAVLEADRLTETVLAEMEYAGNNLQERLESMLSLGVDQAGKVQEAHQIRNRIIYEHDFSVSRDEAQRILDLYEDFLDRWEIL